MSPLRIACISALLFACGGSSASPVLGADPTTTPGLPTSPSSDGGTTDGAVTDGGTTDGSIVVPKDTRIDPIEVGHAWTFDVTVLGFYPACDNGVNIATVIGERTLDGRTARDLQSLCKNAGIFTYSVDGDTVRTYWNDGWHVSLDAPVAEGHTWSDGLSEYRWESKGTVKTAAGTFDDCWSATKVASYPYYTVFCRGVGPIRWHYEDGFGNGYDASIISKNF